MGGRGRLGSSNRHHYCCDCPPPFHSFSLSLSLCLSRRTLCLPWAPMLPSRTKSGLSEASANKSTPKTGKLPRVASTKSDSNSPSTLQKPRTSVDRSSRPVDSKLTIERRSTKISTTTDKRPRALKASELHADLSAVQEELKKAIERLTSVEIEKARVVEELKDAKRVANETYEKLQEAISAKKRAEETLEIKKFRADEMEQEGIEAAQKREEDWLKELESVQNQHGTDATALVSTKEELQKVKHELAAASDPKKAALTNADDAMKIAEMNAEKAEILTAEVNRLKALLDSNMESMNNEAAELVRKLDSEVDSLKCELERAKAGEGKLVEMESLVNGLRTEVSDAKRAERDAIEQIDEWKKKLELLQDQVEEASHAQKSSLDSLAWAMKEMEENNALLGTAQSTVGGLKAKVESLEIELARTKADLEESYKHLDAAKQEALEIGREVEILGSELRAMEEEKRRALYNEKVAISNNESLVEERNKLMIELEVARDEGEKVKKAMEDLASALHVVSMEAREAQERLLLEQANADDARTEIEELKAALKNTEENYEILLDEAKYEIVCLRKAAERIEMEAKDLKNEWDAKELSFVNAIKKLEEEIAALKLEMGSSVESLYRAEEETKAGNKEQDQIVNKLWEAETETSRATEAVERVRAESLKFREGLLDKENEIQSIFQENNDLRTREAAALKKIKELSALLEETRAKKTNENGKLSRKADENEMAKLTLEAPFGKLVESHGEDAILNGNGYGNGNRVDEEPIKVEVKDVSAEREYEEESVDDELESKMDTDSFDQINGSISPSRQKKKKALLGKFGSLLKKKGNHK